MAKKKIETNSFGMVAEFHHLANHPVADGGDAKLPSLQIVRFREHFKLEEIIEGLQALSHKDSLTANRTIDLLRQAQAKWNELQEVDLDADLIGYADSLGDLRYVTDGAAHCYNMNFNEVFQEVHVKNLTRFPANKVELEATLQKAEREGVEVTYEQIDEHAYVVKRADNGKVFKNAMFLLPDLGPIIGVKQ